jgi:hypothetical protein
MCLRIRRKWHVLKRRDTYRVLVVKPEEMSSF